MASSQIGKRSYCDPKNSLAFSKNSLDRTKKDDTFFSNVFKDKIGKIVLFDSQLHPLVVWKNPQQYSENMLTLSRSFVIAWKDMKEFADLTEAQFKKFIYLGTNNDIPYFATTTSTLVRVFASFTFRNRIQLSNMTLEI